jgi:primosomal replication protein N
VKNSHLHDGRRIKTKTKKLRKIPQGAGVHLIGFLGVRDRSRRLHTLHLSTTGGKLPYENSAPLP